MSKSIWDFTTGKEKLSEDYVKTDYASISENASYDPVPCSENVSNFTVLPEVNSFTLTWSNPKNKFFSFVIILMDVQGTVSGCNISQAIPIYEGNSESFTYFVEKDEKQLYYHKFWICAFSGSPVPTRKLLNWSSR